MLERELGKFLFLRPAMAQYGSGRHGNDKDKNTRGQASERLVAEGSVKGLS
jgi:hypothetical protein